MTAQEYETVKVELEDGVAWMILNRPEKANTQSSGLVWDFDRALRMAERDFDVKVVIVKGNGKGFSPLVPGDDDMVISVKTALYDKAVDTLVLPYRHSFIMNKKKTIAAVINFIRTGRLRASRP